MPPGDSPLQLRRVASPHLVVYEGVLARERPYAPLRGPVRPSEAF